jgi:hypothetical protein
MALRTDLDWIREHTRMRWQERGRSYAVLLCGEKLVAAKAWLTQPHYAPKPCCAGTEDGVISAALSPDGTCIRHGVS